MTYLLLKFIHILGTLLMGSGLIGVWMADLRTRQSRELNVFAEAVRNITIFYDGLVVPGAFLLLISGTWMVVEFYGGWHFLEIPWLAGMVILFIFEFIEGNTVTRRYFMKVHRLTKQALLVEAITPELEKAREESVATFTHFLDLPILFLIVALGTIKPNTWTLFVVGTLMAITIATVLTLYITRLCRKR